MPNVNVGVCNDGGVAESNCCLVDNHVQWVNARMGRIGWCTGCLVSEDAFVQTGHCGTPGPGTRINLTYGTGTANQYAVNVATFRFVNNGVVKGSMGKLPCISRQKGPPRAIGAGCPRPPWDRAAGGIRRRGTVGARPPRLTTANGSREGPDG